RIMATRARVNSMPRFLPHRTMRRSSAAAVLTLLALLAAPSLHAVLLDPAFGVGGKATDAALGGARDFLLEPGSGRIIVLANPTAENSGTVLSAYLPDGTLDTSFGSG